MKENPLGIRERHILLGLYAKECIADKVLNIEDNKFNNEDLMRQVDEDFKTVHADIERMKAAGTLPKAKV